MNPVRLTRVATEPGSNPLRDHNAEAIVLGSVLRLNALYPQCTDLGPDAFDDETNNRIWRMILAAFARKQPVDPATLRVELADQYQAIGGRDYFVNLVDQAVTDVPSLKRAADRVYAAHERRQMLRLAQDIRDAAVNPVTPAHQVTSLASRRLAEHHGQANTSVQTTHQTIDNVIAEIEHGPPPIHTGLQSLDILLNGGLYLGRTVGIRGHKSVGKTILVGTVSHNLTIRQTPHLLLSNETPTNDIQMRSLARHLGVSTTELLDPYNKKRPDLIARARLLKERIPDAALYEYRPGATIDDVERIILTCIHKHGIKGVFLDLLQKLRGKPANITTEEFFRSCSDRLAQIAQTHKIFMIIVGHLNQAGKTYQGEGLDSNVQILIDVERAPDDPFGHLILHYANYTAYPGKPVSQRSMLPNIVLDPTGPHFRDPEDGETGAVAEFTHGQEDRSDK